MYNIVNITDAVINETIYQYLKRKGFSENYVRNLRKKEGYIRLNNETAFTNVVVKNGDVLELYKNPNCPPCSTMQNIIPPNIAYEDEDILVVNKPSGMPCTPSRSHKEYCLVNAVLSYMQPKDASFVVRIVNRLDKDVAGLVCIAKHSLISNLLNENNYIDKTYYAICEGLLTSYAIIDKKIATTKNEFGYNNHKREISENGKLAVTYVTPIVGYKNYTLCRVKIEHGRTHQIRLHMASIQHPLLGDQLYGNASPLISHTALFCGKMNIFNPISKKKICVNAPYPDDMAKLIE